MVIQNKKDKPAKKRGRPKKIKEVIKEKQPERKKKNFKRDYFFAVGRRKEAVARVRYYLKGDGEITINSKKLEIYFPTLPLQRIVKTPFEIAGVKSGNISAKILGGGKRGQAESLRLGIARALEKYDKNLRGKLKKAGLLRRDSRVKERKKYGLKRARRAPQWQKR